ncbi:hypothetical protein J4218_06415 [Candidatus Pacearchaeota archaeon]|nr:hypothetical protein [Candidatus Pacearchaeota archaeon]
MAKKCISCNEVIEEEHGKIKGTLLRVKNENNKNEFIPVCSECQKKTGWEDRAKIKGA